MCVTVISPTITAGICICAFVKGSCWWLRCSENSENGYPGVLMSRNPGDDLQDYQFFHRNKLVEPFSVDLKLGIYDVRFEDFFSLMFDFYGKSGLDW